MFVASVKVGTASIRLSRRFTWLVTYFIVAIGSPAVAMRENRSATASKAIFFIGFLLIWYISYGMPRCEGHFR